MIYGLAIRYIAAGDPQVEDGYCGFTAVCDVDPTEYTDEHLAEFVHQLTERVEGQKPAIAMWRRRPQTQQWKDFETQQRHVRMTARASWSNRKRAEGSLTEWIVVEGAQDAVSIHSIPGSKTHQRVDMEETCSVENVEGKGGKDDFSVRAQLPDGREVQLWPGFVAPDTIGPQGSITKVRETPLDLPEFDWDESVDR